MNTDAVDARTLAMVLRADLLPEAYIAPRALRDFRELLRQRVVLSPMRSALKNPCMPCTARERIQRAHADLFGWRPGASCAETAAPAAFTVKPLAGVKVSDATTAPLPYQAPWKLALTGEPRPR